MKKISLIIPIYNTKNELERCLNSACRQIYTNIEIICIDDGSTDGSETILDCFAAKDSRIIAVHQDNMGECGARNTGLKIASGDYIAFMDCDDWIEDNMYEILVKEMESYDLDIAASGWWCDTLTHTKEITNDLPVSKHVFGRDVLLKYIYMRDSYRGFAYMWNKLYKREVLQNTSGELMMFDENLKLGGDVIYLAEASLRARRIKYIDRAFYHYTQREESGCHTKNTEKLRDWLRAYEYIITKFEHEKIEQETVDYVKRFMAYHSSNAAEIAYIKNESKALKDFQKIMERYKGEYIRLNLHESSRIIRFDKILSYEL